MSVTLANQALQGISRGLIIRQPWIGKILSGEKLWEMRSTATDICERIALIEQGTSLIVGECWITGSVGPLETEHAMRVTEHLHCVEDYALLKKWKYPWLLSEVKRYEEPIPYIHPRGAVIWVKDIQSRISLEAA